MADRYWVGGTGTWTTSSTAFWSATSGGATGASAPTATDNAFIDANSGTGTITGNGVCLNLDMTGYTGTFTPGALTIHGDVTASASATYTGGSTTNLSGTTCAFKSNGVTWSGTVNINSGCAVTCLDAFSVSLNLAGINGSFDANGFNVTIGNQWSCGGSSAFTFTMGSGQWTNGFVSMTNGTGLTLNAGTSLLKCVSTSFSLAGNTTSTVTFNNIEVVNALRLAVSGKINVANLTFDSVGSILQIGASTSILGFTGDLIFPAGSAGNMNTITCASLTSQGTISKASGTMALDRVALQGINCTGGATFTATNSVDLYNNSGITITEPGAPPVTRGVATFGFG